MTDIDTGARAAGTVADAVPKAANPEEIGLAVAMVRLCHLVQRVFGEVSHDNGLTPQQTQLLCQLIGGPVGMTELSRTLDLEKSSLTGLVDRVERRGLVTRTRSTRDRRAYHVALTELGVRLGIRSHQSVVARLESLIGDMSPADRERLTSVITEIISRAAPPRERGPLAGERRGLRG